MTTCPSWKSLFNDWPIDLPQRGALVTSLNETIPFRNFWLKEELLLLERTNPDVAGGRFLLLNLDEISLLKFTDPLNESTIAGAGFATVGSNNLQRST